MMVNDLTSTHKHTERFAKLQKTDDMCRACRMGKAHKLYFPGHFDHAAEVGEILRSDIMGPLELSFPDKYKYVSTFNDDHFRYTLVGFMTRRSLLVQTFKQASAKFSDIGERIKVNALHSDGAKEYAAVQHDIGGSESKEVILPTIHS